MNRREFLMTAAAAGLAGCATSGDKACAAKAGSCSGKILFDLFTFYIFQIIKFVLKCFKAFLCVKLSLSRHVFFLLYN